MRPAFGLGCGGAIAPEGAQGAARRAAGDRRARRRQRRARARDRPGQRVIEAGGGPAELGVALAAVADHRVERVGGAVARPRRRARPPRPRAARRRLRRRCSRPPTPPSARQMPSASRASGSRPTRAGERLARGPEVAAAHVGGHGLGLAGQRAAAQGGPRARGQHEAAGSTRAAASAPSAAAPPGRRRRARRGRASARRAPLERQREPAEARDRVPAARVAEDLVGRPAGEEREAAHATAATGAGALTRVTVQRPSWACSSASASGATSTRQNASSGAPSAATIAALTTPPWVMATARPSARRLLVEPRRHPCRERAQRLAAVRRGVGVGQPGSRRGRLQARPASAPPRLRSRTRPARARAPGPGPRPRPSPGSAGPGCTARRRGRQHERRPRRRGRRTSSALVVAREGRRAGGRRGRVPHEHEAPHAVLRSFGTASTSSGSSVPEVGVPRRASS